MADVPESVGSGGTPPPSFATVDQLNQLERGLGQAIGQLGQTFEAALDRASKKDSIRPPVHNPYRPSKEELDEAYVKGDLSSVFGKMFDSQKEEVKSQIREEMGEQLAKGRDAISRLTAQTVRSKLPHYDRFKEEIERTVSTLPEEARMNPESWTSVHDYVVGKNASKLIEEAKEEAVRASRGKPNLPGSNRGGSSLPNIPELADALGVDAAKAIELRGLTPDDWAKKMRFKSWADYYEKRVKPAREMTSGRES